ncbi:MAG: glutamine synthetase III [Dysgonamonadaceae bacterium]|jgi:glutamine synthetase|nr:glutamine synthetase III [Dysgonamonadaceae bacterium]MDD3308675.1 glutamine synthetase III [Dysgonamonadaceae bacterium]MDD3899733.1 glutamine synthetase III [Dysgonamonadaceae bacterium]MDD4397988.1 glutamine synthetase III [Dysgonamonadaceae bacterium]MEA5081643.1 glutamine synthetase III [Dysgonamonadaceae bacterium]
MSNLRFSAVKEAFKRKANEVSVPLEKTSEYFGKYVFDRNNMHKYLSKETLNLVLNAIDKGELLAREVANHVAAGMRMWAMEMGATHYTHWFHPLTNGTAEKHDAFIDFDGHGGVIEEFSGKLLVQQEPDASSFPSGGIRNTFEARGYTAWDPSSPAFIINDTLCIPTIFISYTGESLDYKMPLLKSIAAIDKAATEVCQYFDKGVKKVFSYLGWEQEYFLVDKALYDARPDLSLTGRTLMGHESAKNQQLEDHYFGSIPTRVCAFMRDLEYECYKLSIPVKTRHNEVAPNQFELAPIFEECNLAVDHNQLLMSIMDVVADRHGFKVLLHEKPFKGINGSGKHNNWSLGTDTSVNLMGPGKNADENLQFITFISNVMMAVYKNNALLKASISSASNAHRLGANEAPPSIISIFMGSQISALLDEIESSKGIKEIELSKKIGKRFSLNYIPEIMVDNTDRNRTSPFAFTGNRFEFRAVGSSANCAAAMLALNTAVAGQLMQFKVEVDSLIASGKAKIEAVLEVVRKYICDSKVIRFDGNSYSDEWKAEAQKRGLDCETKVPIVYDAYVTPQAVDLFSQTGVLNERELHARNEVKWEQYTKEIQIEARVLGDLAMNHIIPVATRYQGLLLDNVSKIFALYDKEKASKIATHDIAIIEDIADHLNYIKIKTDEMVETRKQANIIENEREKALMYCEKVAPYFDEIRYHIDKLELTVDNEMWTLPKYRELLFIR